MINNEINGLVLVLIDRNIECDEKLAQSQFMNHSVFFTLILNSKNQQQTHSEKFEEYFKEITKLDWNNQSSYRFIFYQVIYKSMIYLISQFLLF